MININFCMKGPELKTFRNKLNLTQDQMALRLNVASNTISRWEIEERKIPEFLELALKSIEMEIILEQVLSDLDKTKNTVTIDDDLFAQLNKTNFWDIVFKFQV